MVDVVGVLRKWEIPICAIRHPGLLFIPSILGSDIDFWHFLISVRGICAIEARLLSVCSTQIETMNEAHHPALR